MGQQEIIDTLRQSKRPLSRTEIADILKVQPKHVSNKIKILVRYDEVKFVELSREQALEKYHCKRKMRLYYIDGR
jgi:Mn-dependent DtxR family transcriptional regulator